MTANFFLLFTSKKHIEPPHSSIGR